MESRQFNLGFNLIELTLSICVLGILAVTAIPSWNDMIEKRKLKKVTEIIYKTVKLAHSEAIKRKSNITVSVTSGSNWCIGMSDSGDCDCSTVNSCTVSGVEQGFNNAQYDGITLAVSGLSGTTSKYLQLGGIRGIAETSGSVTVSNTNYSVTISINKLGLVQTCSNQLKDYSLC